MRQFPVGRNRLAAKEMVAQAEQHEFAAGKIFGLINRVAVAFLLLLHGKGYAPGKVSHLFRFAQQRGMFFQALADRRGPGLAR